MAHEQLSKRDNLRRGFLRTLVVDLQSAFDRIVADDTPGHRREAIRTMFAAVEGVAWMYREHVRSAAEILEMMTPLLDMAFSERTYAVSERGEVIEQTRFVSVTAMIRLATQVAERACPELNIDFGHVAWPNLKESIGVRNRLTHPKTEADLEISSEELSKAKSAFFWLLALTVEVGSAMNRASTTYASEARQLIDELVGGDAQALSEYRAALLENIARDRTS